MWFLATLSSSRVFIPQGTLYQGSGDLDLLAINSSSFDPEAVQDATE